MSSTLPPAEALLLQSLVNATDKGIASRVLARTAGGNLTIFAFAAGEEMRTEISTKFMRPGLEGIYAEAGLELTDWWTDDEGLYALSLARAV